MGSGRPNSQVPRERGGLYVPGRRKTVVRLSSSIIIEKHAYLFTNTRMVGTDAQALRIPDPPPIATAVVLTLRIERQTTTTVCDALLFILAKSFPGKLNCWETFAESMLACEKIGK